MYVIIVLMQFLSVVGKEEVLKEVEEFVLSSLRSVNGSTSHHQPKKKLPEEVVIQSCKELAMAAQGMLLCEVGVHC